MGQHEIISCLHDITAKPNKEMFNFIEVIGKGSYGKVWKVEYAKYKKPLALKVMSKSTIIKKKMQKNTLSEKKILTSLYNPFIANMYCTFQDHNYLYMLMDFSGCGDLRYQMSFIRHYTESQLRFIAACIILGLEHLHSKGIVHRDIKPENLIMDKHGYIKLCDFGIAKKLKDELNGDFLDISGTPGYIAPEVVFHKKISYESDYFSLGIVLYELIMDDIPFKGNTSKEMREEFNKSSTNEYLTTENCDYSDDLCDFVNKLLEIDNNKRIGRFGIDEIKAHAFFKHDFNWKNISQRQMKCPFVPRSYHYETDDNYSRSNSSECCSNNGSITTDDNSPKGNDVCNESESCFRKYTFIRKIERKKCKGTITSYRTDLYETVNGSTMTSMKMFKSTAVSPVKKNGFKLIYGNQQHPVKLLKGKKSSLYSDKKQISSSVPKDECELPKINSVNRISTNESSHKSVIRSNSKPNANNINTNISIMEKILSAKGKIMKKQSIDFSSQLHKYKLVSQKAKRRSCFEKENSIKRASSLLC